MPGRREVAAIFRRMSDDESFRAALRHAAGGERRLRLLCSAGFPVEFTPEEVYAEAQSLLPQDKIIAGIVASHTGEPERFREQQAAASVAAFGALVASAVGSAAGPRQRSFLVNFIVVGAQKSGTTALDYFLHQHPDVCTANPKETHFFKRDVFFSEAEDPSYEWYHLNFRDYRGEIAVGEATPDYMYYPNVLQRMRRYNELLRLVVLLRNPIDRAYSHYCMRVRRGIEHRSFGTALADEAAHLDQLRAANGGPVLGDPERVVGYISNGLYSLQVSNLLKSFPPSQVLYLRSEDLRLHHSETLRQLYSFIGVSSDDVPPQREVHAGSYRPMLEEDRLLLREVLRPDVHALEELLGWDLQHWLQ